MKKKYINIHHTAIYAEDDKAEQFDAVDEGHRKKWGNKSAMGYFGGYHYLVERNGFVGQFRNDWETGVHNKKSLMNYRAIGVCFAGNMSRQKLTRDQVKFSVELIKRLQNKYDIPDENVTPHRLYKATQCPGNFLVDPVWEYLQEEYDKMDTEKWKKEAQKWAMDNGISNGERPDDYMTRVELWQTLKNFNETFNS